MRLCAFGDIVLHDGLKPASGKQYLASLKQEIERSSGRPDLVLANLEAPLTESNKPRWSHLPAKKAPPALAGVLSDLPVDFVTLANNHISDYDRRGLADTIRLVDGLGIKWAGAGWNAEQARAPILFEKAGLRIGILALAQPELSAAWEGSWGAGVLDERYAIAAMKQLSAQVDVAIAYLHFGVEFFGYPTPRQIKMSRSLIDAGAKLVLGHHPHVAQGFEWYKNGFIAYSLGNFIFPMKLRGHEHIGVGLMVDIEVDREKVREVRVVPMETRGGLPRVLAGDERREAEDYLAAISEPIADASAMEPIYYRICRDNFSIHMNALIKYGILKMKPERIASWLHFQSWPQIRQLRKDLAGFLFSGRAWDIEKKAPFSHGTTVFVWRLVCIAAKCAGLLLPRKWRKLDLA